MKNRLAKWHNNGRVQQVFTYLVFLMVASIAAILLEIICTGLVLSRVDGVLSDYVPLNQISPVKAKLAATSVGFGLQLFWIIFFIVVSGWGLLKLSTRLNLVGRVTLNKAIRFSDAMERLGLIHEW